MASYAPTSSAVSLAPPTKSSTPSTDAHLLSSLKSPAKSVFIGATFAMILLSCDVEVNVYLLKSLDCFRANDTSAASHKVAEQSLYLWFAQTDPVLIILIDAVLTRASLTRSRTPGIKGYCWPRRHGAFDPSEQIGTFGFLTFACI